MDDLYNSISKASANYLPQLQVKAREFEGRPVSVTLVLADPRQAEETAPLFAKGGAAVEVAGSNLKVEGDLGQILANCLTDAGDMFENAGDRIREKYGTPERRVLYNWWSALKEAEKQLNKQKKFQEANFIGTVMKKGVECSYNYYTTEPKKITEKTWNRGLLPGFLRGLHGLVRICHHVPVPRAGTEAGTLMNRRG